MSLPYANVQKTLSDFLDLKDIVETGEHRTFDRAIVGSLGGKLVTILIDNTHGHAILGGGELIGVGDGVAFQSPNQHWNISR